MNHNRIVAMRVMGLIGLLSGVAACSAREQPAAPVTAPVSQPIPAAAQPTPASAATPAAQPGGEKKEEKVPTCLGPDGKEHEFPLKVYDENADPVQTIRDGIA